MPPRPAHPLPLSGASAALPRRRWLALAAAGPLAGLAGCAASLPEVPPGAGSPSARQRLAQAAAAHGQAAWEQVHDLNARFSQPWPLLGRSAATAMADANAANTPLELRLLRASGQVALSPRPAGRQGADLRVAALRVDAHRLLLLGPLGLTPAGPVNWGPPETLDGQRCDQIVLDLAPGLGGGAPDRLAVFIDREQALMRRLRVALGAFSGGSGQAPVAEVDCFEPIRLNGLVWMRRYQVAGALPGGPPTVWRLTGLDLDRGYGLEALAGPGFSGAAAAPAQPLPTG